MNRIFALLAVAFLAVACGDEAAETPLPATPIAEETAPGPEAAPSFTRSGEVPAGQAVLAALRASGVSAEALLGRPLPVGDGRFVVVATSGGEVPLLHAAVASDNGGAQLEHTLPLVLGSEIDGQVDPVRVAAREAGDFDGDSEPEVYLLVRYTTLPEPAVGESVVGHYFMLDLDPVLTIAISMETQRAGSSSETRGAVRLRDVDDDGHDDFTVRFRECEMDMDAPDGESCRQNDLVRHYDPATDSWPTS